MLRLRENVTLIYDHAHPHDSRAAAGRDPLAAENPENAATGKYINLALL